MDPVTLTLGKKYTRKKVVPAYALGYNPAIDIVYESGYREALKDQGEVDVYTNGIKTDSGHGWVAEEGEGGSQPILHYSNGVLRAESTGSGRRGWNRIGGFGAVYPYVSARYLSYGPTNERWVYVKYRDFENWILVYTFRTTVAVEVCVNGVETRLASFWGSAVDSPSAYGVTSELQASIRQVHGSFSPSERVLWLRLDGGLLNELVPIPAEAWDALGGEGSVGFGSRNAPIYSFRAGYAQGVDRG